MKLINRRVLMPLIVDLGGRYLVKPYLGKYSDEEKTARWGFGYKKHGDKRHRTTVEYQGINYVDGENARGQDATSALRTATSAWSKSSTTTGRRRTTRPSRLQKKASFEETYNQIETFSSRWI